jgi:drug/metabolite transporter (DMT)-like permease
MISGLKRLTQALYRWPGLLLTLAAVFWAGNTVAARLAIDQISPFMLTSLRWVLVAAVLWPVYGGEIRKHWPQIRPRLSGIVMLAIFGMTGFNALYYVAAHYTSAINMGILQGALPIFVLAGAFLAHGTRGGLVQLAGVLITAVGVVVVATRGEPLAILEVEFNKGDLAMLAACVLYAFYTVALRDRPLMPGAAFFTLLALIAAVTSLPLVALEALTTGVTMPTLQGWLVTAWVAIFPSTLSQLFYLRGVDLIGPGRAGVFINLVPVFSAVLAVVLIDEPFAAFHAVALVLVIGGIWLAQRTA